MDDTKYSNVLIPCPYCSSNNKVESTVIGKDFLMSVAPIPILESLLGKKLTCRKCRYSFNIVLRTYAISVLL